VDTQQPSLEWIYETYHAKVVAYAAKLLGRDDAEDVAHEVFLKVGRALSTLADPSRLTSWIYAIAANTVRDVARARAVRLARQTAPRPGSDDADPLANLSDTAARTAEQVVARHEMVACYLDYVARLPANYFDVYVMAELEELSIPEIARRLSISVGAAKIRLHRARARLFEELRRHCRCYVDDDGSLLGEPKSVASSTSSQPASSPSRARARKD
jgi:RNA polymerase sigma-70 factor (ECF subfamily)